MAFLTPDEKRTLAALCDTFIPALAPKAGDNPALFALHAGQYRLVDDLESAFEQVTEPSQRAQLKLALKALEVGAVNGISAGAWRGFSDLTPEEQTVALRAWGNSPIPAARQLFQSVKRLSLFLFYGGMPEGKNHPAWDVFGYGGHPILPENGTRPIKPLAINGATTLHTDVLIVGSGAGGGVAAGELTAAGLDVIVVEKGGYHAESDFHGHELSSTQTLFEKQGAMTTSDVGMIVLAGSTLGGGTTINWAASLRTPDDVLNEWENEYGFSGAAGADFQRSLDAVMKRINVNTDESKLNTNNAMLLKGCEKLGYDVGVIPRNVKGCEECGFCNFGCSFGAKQGTLKTYLQDAHDRGARMIVRAKVKQVLHEHGRATGASLTVQDADGISHEVTVKAEAVIVSAGAIHTPALLLRSGLGNAHIGANVHLHPVTVTYGLFDEPITPWQGAPMSRLSREFANLDGRGYGVRLETAPVHPGITALTMPWQSGAAHKRLLQNINYMTNIIVLTRDFYGGRVTTNRAGDPILHYKLHQYDAKHLMRGTLESLRVHLAAGAREVSSPHNNNLTFRPDKSDNLEAYLSEVEKRGLRSNAYMLFSAHQMSSCRIGGDSATGAVDPTGESYEIDNLFVVDGSVLPTASGVNPMITIMGTAHYLAQHIKAKLT